MGKAIFKNVVIAGIGLMGGSLGLALKKHQLAEKVTGYARRSATIKEAKKIGAIDNGYTDPKEAARDADLIVFAGPVSTTPVLFNAMVDHISDDCILTDVGSTKAELIKTMNRLVKQVNKQGKRLTYIGAHPMAGSEKTGVQASLVSLYEKSICVLINENKQENGSLIKMKKMWKVVGCDRIIICSGKEHDALTAFISHLPHAAAVTLTSAVSKQAAFNKTLIKLISSGFKDTTRIAAGSPDMWVDIFISNKKDVVKSINAFQKELDELKMLVIKEDRHDLTSYLQAVQDFRMKVVK